MTAGRTQGPSDTSARCPGQLSDTAGPRTQAHGPGRACRLRGHLDQARGTQDSWSILRALRYGPESPGGAGRPRETSVQGQGRPGYLVDTARPRIWAQVARDCWSNPGALGPMLESPKTAVQHPGPWAQARETRVSWWTPRALGHGPESPGKADRTCGHSDQVPNRPGHLVDTVGPRTRA